jgi:uncharacterized protein (DUF983 family)
MGCVVCGRRQTDPARGASPWQRGVVRGEQVLGCPDCQRSGAWARVLDACASCGSTALVRRLGDTVCRACGHAGDAVPAGDGPALPGDGPASVGERPGTRPLADEVSEALDRFFGRSDD